MLEYEVKVMGIDFAKVEARIIELGGKKLVFEDQENIILDNKSSPLSDRGSYLRIRTKKNLDTGEIKTVITLKENMGVGKIRTNKEINLEVNSKSQATDFLEALGYEIESIGYKNRKSYIYGPYRFDFDTWDKDTYPKPYLEIELPSQENLEDLLMLLDIPKACVSNKSIKELREELK